MNICMGCMEKLEQGEELLLDKQGDIFAMVNENSEQNKQYVAMQFIHFMLSEDGQNIMHVENLLNIPVNKAAMANLIVNTPEFGIIEPFLNSANAQKSITTTQK